MSFPLYSKKKDAIDDAKTCISVNEMMYITSPRDLSFLHGDDWYVAKVKGTAGFIQGSENPDKTMYANVSAGRRGSKKIATQKLMKMGLTVLDVNYITRPKPAEIRKTGLKYAKHLKKDVQRKAMLSLGCRPGQAWIKGKCKKIKE